VFESAHAENRDVKVLRMHRAGNNAPAHRCVGMPLWKLSLNLSDLNEKLNGSQISNSILSDFLQVLDIRH
jgi:hypothetical protein